MSAEHLTPDLMSLKERVSTLRQLESPQARAECAQLIRDYSVSQVETWRRIPMAALMADEDPGVNGDNAPAYWDGYLPLLSSIRPDDPAPAVLVDLETGELVRGHRYDEVNEQTEFHRGNAQPEVPAEDEDLLRIRLEELNARDLLDELIERQVRVSVLEDPVNAEWITSKRKAVIKRVSLGLPYTRRNPQS